MHPSAMINPEHFAEDSDNLRMKSEILRRSGRVFIENFLTADLAREVHSCLQNDTPWEMVYREENENRTLSNVLLQNSSNKELIELQSKIVEQAKHTYQFCFDRYPMLDAYLNGDQTVPLLNQILDWVNSPDFLNYCHQLTGDQEIRKVELQATRYRAGSFLKEHDDHAEIEDDRRYACVLNLTEAWSADWGGVLQFTTQGQVTETFNPLFNSLAVFKVPQTHQVSFVAPFASGARYALTGWMRAD